MLYLGPNGVTLHKKIKMVFSNGQVIVEATAAKKYLTLSGSSGVVGTRPVHWANNKEATGHLHFYKQIYM